MRPEPQQYEDNPAVLRVLVCPLCGVQVLVLNLVVPVWCGRCPDSQLVRWRI